MKIEYYIRNKGIDNQENGPFNEWDIEALYLSNIITDNTEIKSINDDWWWNISELPLYKSLVESNPLTILEKNQP